MLLIVLSGREDAVEFDRCFLVESSDGDVGPEAAGHGEFLLDDPNDSSSGPVMEDDLVSDVALVVLGHEDVAGRDEGAGADIVRSHTCHIEFARPAACPKDVVIGGVAIK